MRSAEDLAALMPDSGEVQVVQTRFRLRLVESWQIPAGARVLEIGSGQGDATAVLAEAVGPAGRVTAVDLAAPTYGAPFTLGDSMQHLIDGPLGSRIESHFNFDVLDPANAFPPDAFDFIVLAHCTWYFQSLIQLKETLARVRPWGKKLCLSEWDMQPQSIDQLGHLLSVLIQGEVEAYKSASESNIRTPYSREALRLVLEETGWKIDSEHLIDTGGMQDAKWEIDMCLEDAVREAEEFGLPVKLKDMISSQTDILRRLAETTQNRPLPAYSINAS